MTPLQIKNVQESFAMIAPDRDQVARMFYDRLFEQDPALRPMFTSDLAEQRRKLMTALKLTVHSLDRIGGMVPVLRDLGVRHVIYGVKDEDYDTVGAALIWTLEQGLGEAFTEELKQSWIAAYTLIADTMLEGAHIAKCA